ncbi:MAG: type II toxin-antitoxin system RelE/ParE family toxin [Oscillospiraceae bacterium]|nr:type II toxin-antitoxin system RelE/ParE family toxin [Oscillospiraceae bacterium]
MNYEYEIRKKAMKFIQKQERSQQIRILRAIYLIPQGDIKKMQSFTNLYHLRVGDYRILFEMNQKTDTITLITITDADSRGQIYK